MHYAIGGSLYQRIKHVKWEELEYTSLANTPQLKKNGTLQAYWPESEDIQGCHSRPMPSWGQVSRLGAISLTVSVLFIHGRRGEPDPHGGCLSSAYLVEVSILQHLYAADTRIGQLVFIWIPLLGRHDRQLTQRFPF